VVVRRLRDIFFDIHIKNILFQFLAYYLQDEQQLVGAVVTAVVQLDGQ
jgi:hypothetical protein